MRRRILNRKSLRFLSALLLLILLLALPAFAEGEEGEESEEEDEFTYSGVLDPETGSAPGVSTVQEDGRIEVSADMVYDNIRKLFAFPLADGTELFCSAADGMVTTGRVALDYGGPSPLTVYRNGETVDMAGTGEVREPGVYVVTVGGDSAERVLSFTLLAASTNQIRSYTVPEGFLLRGAERDGEEIEQEGLYVIRYRCPVIDRDYTLTVVIDRTPPALTLSGSVGKDGRVHSAVVVSGLETGDTLYVTHDGAPLGVALEEGKATLTETGVYTVTAADPAGNPVTYEFTIVLYLNTNAIVFILLLAAVVASIFIYAFWKRRSLKVR